MIIANKCHSMYSRYKGSPRQNFFLSAGHPLTVPNGVILCPKNDAIKKIWVYIDFMKEGQHH